MGQLNGGGQLSQLHVGPVGAVGGGGHQAPSPGLLSAASQTYQIGSTAPTMIAHHQLSPVSANITLMGQSNGKSTAHNSHKYIQGVRPVVVTRVFVSIYLWRFRCLKDNRDNLRSVL